MPSSSHRRSSVFFALSLLVVPCLAVVWIVPACDSSGNILAGTDANAVSSFTLTSLSVAATSDPNATSLLVPAFAPGTRDYYVRCAAGANSFTVSMTASTGAHAALIQPTAVSADVALVSVNENQAIVAVATGGTSASPATTQYWVRCLPHDFPTLKMELHPEVGKPTPGYYMVGTQFVPLGTAGYAMILDGNGVPVWYYREINGTQVFDVDHVVRGAVSFVPGMDDLRFEIHDLMAGTTTYGPGCDVHELQQLPNGNLLVTGEPRDQRNLMGFETPLPDGGHLTFGNNTTTSECVVKESNASDTIVWMWNAENHFVPIEDTTYAEPAYSSSDGGLWVAPFHCNSIDIDLTSPPPYNLLVSGRDMDSIFYIERPSGKVLWKMGGKTASKDHAVYVPVDQPFHRQHDARFQPNWKWTCAGGSGQISLYDNETDWDAGAGKPPMPSRAVVYDVNVVLDPVKGCTESGRGESKATLAWQYQGRVQTFETGSFRILADGSRTIGWGKLSAAGASPGVVFSEITEDGGDILDFYFPDGASTYRAIKIPLTTFDLGLLRNTAGQGGQ
jgi:hypothetical protein